MNHYDVEAVRQHYPALHRMHQEQPVVYACAPGGTQVPEAVIQAMAAYQRSGVSNLHGPFFMSAESDAVVDAARQASADFLGCSNPEQIHFGLNTTSLHFHLSHALARSWHSGDAMIITNIDHDSNIRPWLRAAQAHNVEVRTWHFNPDDGQLHLADLEALLDERVTFVALPAASNALGSIIDLKPAITAAHAFGAVVSVDAVHLAPHQLIDVEELDCDALTCSAYKVYGPHLGMQYLKPALAETLDVDKVKPSPNTGAARWEQGTVNLEALAGWHACVEHLASFAPAQSNRRAQLQEAYAQIVSHEQHLSHIFLQAAEQIPGLRIYGAGLNQLAQRTPTFGCTLDGHDAGALARALGEQGIFTWSGHFYALGVIEALGLESLGGLLRIGFGHYASSDEVERVASALRDIATA